MTDVHANSNAQVGINFQAANSGTIKNIYLQNSHTNDNRTLGGIVVGINSAQAIENFILSNITSSHNNMYGLRIASYTDAVIQNLRIINASLTNNALAGIQFDVQSGASLTGHISHSTIAHNTQSGILFVNDNARLLSVNLGDGTARSGSNSFYGNNPNALANHGDLRLALNGDSITAQGNWWGQTGGPLPGQVVNQNPAACPTYCGTADTSHWLDTDPNI